MWKDKRKTIFYAIWLFFLLFLLFQHRSIFLHFDDFGYASLSFGYTENQHGMSWTIGDLLSFLKWHYFNWGGRILYYGIGIMAMRIGEQFIQVFQALILFVISVLTYQFIQREEEDIFASCMAVCTYGLFGISPACDGIFWYSASEGYVWPFVPLLCGVCLLRKIKLTNKNTFYLCLLFFAAAFSHEQVAIVTIAFVMVYGVKLYREKSMSLQYLFITGFAFLGGILEILAPGNYVRASVKENEAFQALTFIEKVVRNLPKTLKINMNITNIPLLVGLILILFLLGYYFAFEKQIKWRYVLIGINALSSVFVFVSMCTMVKVPVAFGLRLIFAVVFLTECMIYLVYKDATEILALLVGGIGSMCAMVVAPAVDDRCAIPFQIILHIVIGYVLVQELKRLRTAIGKYGIILVIFAVSICSMSYITYGYYQNKPVNELNRRKLQEKSLEIKNGEKIGTIILYRLLDDRFASKMPYEKIYISTWILEYFELPKDLIMVWNEYGKPSEVWEIVETRRIMIDHVWPEQIDELVTFCEDGGVDIAVIPVLEDDNYIIVVNDTECTTVHDVGFMSTHVPKEFLNEDLRIQIKDTVSQELSDVKIIRVIER